MSSHVKTIVIGTALTPGSEGIVRTGVALARATGASPWLVHAYVPTAFPAEIGALDSRWMEAEIQDLRQRLDRQARQTGLAELPGFGPDHEYLAMGAPHLEIVEVARRVHADLIVMGASEAGAIHRAFLGSTADRVVRKAPCPVLVVRSETAFPPSQVLVPVDLSSPAASALRWGLGFLADVGGEAPAEATALFVLNPLEVSGSLQFTAGQIARFASEEVHRFVAENVPDGKVLCRVLTGYPREEILYAATEQQADLVILGTHGRGGLVRMMIGSVAIQVLERAFCNVLVVPLGTESTDERLEEQGADAAWKLAAEQAPPAAAPSEMRIAP